MECVPHSARAKDVRPGVGTTVASRAARPPPVSLRTVTPRSCGAPASGSLIEKGVSKMVLRREEKVRVLVADDDEMIRQVLTEFVGRFYDCEAVGSAEDALDALGVEPFNVVLCDVTMGGMTGLEMVPRVRALAPETVCVIISGAQAVETAVEAMRVGAFDYLTKPFDFAQVEAVVRRAVEHQKLLATKRRYELYLEEAIRERTAQLDQALALLEDAYRTTLRALVAALEMRDTDTHGHSERVVSFSLRLGRELGLDPDQMRSLE